MVSKISGIYGYYDNLRCEIVYVGKDSNIEKNVRHKEHHQLSKKDKQVINKILQNDNSGRYIYVVLEQGYFTDDELNQKEISWISFFNPRFNFTKGGDGFGSGENHPMYGKKRSEETRQKMSEVKKGEKHPMFGKTPSDEHRQKISEAKTKNYARVIKSGFNRGKQMYALRYNGKRIKRSINKDKLEKMAKEINKGD